MTRLPPETHLLVIWEHGRPQADRIIADARRRFTPLAGYEVTWSRRDEPRHFSRLYGQSLPPGSDKVEDCGLGPFLLLVVRDESPRYGSRRKWGSRVVVNTHLFDAKERYRSWTRGPRVHNSTDQAEADRDLFVLLGRRRQDFEGQLPTWDGSFEPVTRDPAGTDGWESWQQLLTAVDLTLPSVVLPSVDPATERLRLLVEASFEHWGVEWLVAEPADVPLAGRGPDYPVVVAGRPCVLELHRIGDGHMPSAWQQVLLDSRVRAADGSWVPHPREEYWALLHAVAALGHPPDSALRERLTAAALNGGVRPVDATDARGVEAALRAHAEACVTPPAPAVPLRHGRALLGRRRRRQVG